MRKGFTVGQVFIYLMTLIVFVVILTFGYNAIFTVKCKADRVSCVQFENQFSSRITSIASQYNSVRIHDFTVPASISKVCLVDLSVNPDVDSSVTVDSAGICVPGEKNYDPVLCDSWKEGGDNVFLYGPISDCQPCDNFRVEELRLDEGSLCLQSSTGRVTLKMEGLGKSARVSIPPRS